MQFNCSPQQIISEVSTGGNGSLSSQSDLFMELKPHSSEPSNLSLALLLTDRHPTTVSKMPEKLQNKLGCTYDAVQMNHLAVLYHHLLGAILYWGNRQ